MTANNAHSIVKKEIDPKAKELLSHGIRKE